jgi:sn-glycerol 3-phosphate transport system substrate-binding protein
MTRHPRCLRALVLATVIALAAGACGGDDGGGGGGGDGRGGGDGGGGDDGAGQAADCPVDALDVADGRVEVVAWHTQAARPLTTLEALVAEYNDSQSKVRVRLESQGASYDEIQRKFNQAVSSGQLPALVMVDDTFTRSMADSGVILPAQGCFDASGTDLDGLDPTARNYYTIDGQLWAASAGLGNVLLYYNRNHFRRAGLDPEAPPSTLAELRETAESLRDAGVTETPFVHELSSWKTEFWLTGAGSSVVDNDNGRGDGETTEATLAGNPEALELFEWFDSMEQDGLLQPIPATPGQIDQYVAMANQTASMLIDTSSAATSIEAFLAGDLDPSELGEGESPEVDLDQLDLAVGPLPGLDEPGRTQMGGAAWYMTNGVPEEVQAGAWDFMQFMNAPGTQAEMLVGGSYLPWVTATLDERSVQQYFAGKGGIAGAWLEVANDEVLDLDPEFPGPLIGPYDQFREAVQKAQDDLLFADASPSAALDAAQADVTAALERYNQENF